ncbi:hypothetical protein [Polaromonas sp. UC242_47]|uniref:hypothetical protein n=1 Tax=Polaromonas sp. UC242_47 TaxID=3374626 RepID=UPI0037C7CD62
MAFFFTQTDVGARRFILPGFGVDPGAVRGQDLLGATQVLRQFVAVTLLDGTALRFGKLLFIHQLDAVVHGCPRSQARQLTNGLLL